MSFPVCGSRISAAATLGVFFALLLPLANLGMFTANYFFNSNLNTVEAGRFYRAAEMNASRLTSVIKALGIRTVVDLRNSLDRPREGVREFEVVQQAGADYYHVKLRSTALPSRFAVEELFHIFEEAQEPILVHCSSGSERSAFVSAVWLIDHEDRSVDEALKQFQVRYGYFTPERVWKRYSTGRSMIEDLLYAYREELTRREISVRDFFKEFPLVPLDE